MPAACAQAGRGSSAAGWDAVLFRCDLRRLVEERLHRVIKGIHPRRVMNRGERSSQKRPVRLVAIRQDVIGLVVFPLLERLGDAIDVDLEDYH